MARDITYAKHNNKNKGNKIILLVFLTSFELTYCD